MADVCMKFHLPKILWCLRNEVQRKDLMLLPMTMLDNDPDVAPAC